jgi:hypothetical protein
MLVLRVAGQKAREASQGGSLEVTGNFLVNFIILIGLKGQSHENVGELRVWEGSLGPN